MIFSISLNVRHAGCRNPGVKSCNTSIVFYSIIRTKSAQHNCSKNIVYIVCTPTCFDAAESLSGGLIILLC